MLNISFVVLYGVLYTVSFPRLESTIRGVDGAYHRIMCYTISGCSHNSFA